MSGSARWTDLISDLGRQRLRRVQNLRPSDAVLVLNRQTAPRGDNWQGTQLIGSRRVSVIAERVLQRRIEFLTHRLWSEA
jgi:hypothetical protein